MTEESWKAWKKMSDFGWEINLCIKEQFPLYLDMDSTNEQQIIVLDVYSMLVDELCSQSTRKENEDE